MYFCGVSRYFSFLISDLIYLGLFFFFFLVWPQVCQFVYVFQEFAWLHRLCCFEWIIFYVSMMSIWSIMPFRDIVSLLVFFLDVLSTDVSGVLKSPPIIVFSLISLFMSVNICFVFRSSSVGCIDIYNCLILLLDWSFYCYIMLFFVSCYSLCFKVYFFWYKHYYLSNLVGRGCIDEVFSPHHSTTVCLFIDVFRPLTFQVIIDRMYLLSFLKFVFWLFL